MSKHKRIRRARRALQKVQKWGQDDALIRLHLDIAESYLKSAEAIARRQERVK